MEIYDYNEILEQTVDHLKTGIQLYPTQVPGLNDYYQVKRGGVTDITGYPYSGKTILLNDILFDLAINHNQTHLIHLPDSGKPAEVVAYLLTKRTGKTFDKRQLHRLIDEDDVIKEMRWITDHFKILKKKSGEKPTPMEFWNYAIELGVDNAGIDSWNYMKHPGKGTDYLADVLSERNELAEKSGVHFFTIIHPRNPNTTDYDKNGNLQAPDVTNLMGGSEWNNNAKNVLVVHKESKESKNYDIYIRKVKPRAVGKTGIITVQLDETFARFYKDEQIIENNFRIVSDAGEEADRHPMQTEPEDLPF